MKKKRRTQGLQVRIPTQFLDTSLTWADYTCHGVQA